MQACSARYLAVVLLGLFAVQIVIYHEVFSIKPSVDDYILLGQIRVGEETGPGTFFINSPLNDYRPLQSLIYWAVGRWRVENPFVFIHILSFAAFFFYASVFVLWIRLIPLPRIAVLCGAGFLFLHPILAGPLADLDGFSRFVVSGWVWLGAYAAYRYALWPWLAVSLTSICFVMGLGFMEYAVALVPLSILAMWLGREKDWVRGTLGLGATLMLIFAGYYLLRMSVISYDAGRISLDPAVWARNMVLLGASVLFLGDTVPVYVERTGVLLTTVALSVLVMSGILVLGGWYFYRSGVPASRSAGRLPRTERVFAMLMLGTVASFTPMVFMGHVSEIYTTPIVFPLSLLVGCAMAGWARMPRKYFVACSMVLAACLVWAGMSAGAKVRRLRDTGKRASMQMQELLRWIPDNAHNWRVGLIFVETELPRRRAYSVFHVGDDYLIHPGSTAARAAIEWHRPKRKIELTYLILPEKPEPLIQSFDMILYWNPLTRRFEPWTTP